jgi:hypothetical protein
LKLKQLTTNINEDISNDFEVAGPIDDTKKRVKEEAPSNPRRMIPLSRLKQNCSKTSQQQPR